MKQTLYRAYLFLGFFVLIGLTCYGKVIYTVQVAASKTPTDILWFSGKYQIEKPIVEIREDGWYKYVIGEFENQNEAANYMALHLQARGPQDAFTRILPDSLKLNYQQKPDSLPLSVPDEKRSPAVLSADSGTVANSELVQPLVLEDGAKQSKDLQNPWEEWGPWARWISGGNLHKVELEVIGWIKPILPASLLPFYIKMMDKAIRIPIVMFFIMLIILFIINALLIVIFLELSNTLKNQIERFDQLYRSMYERALTGYIFQEYDLETTIPRIKKIHRTRNRKLFVDVLFNFQKNLSGDLDQKILEVFFRLGLHHDAIRKTHSSSFYHQIVGLSELTNLYPSGAFSIIEGHINDKNNELRAEAQTSYVRLNQEEPFHFLHNLEKPFTYWTQLTSFYIFKLHKLPAPSFVEYLKSDLYNVKDFSLRMIIHFQQKENAQEIIKLLKAKRARTRFLAIRAICELGIHEAKLLLTDNYDKETYPNQHEIVKALRHLGDVEDFVFLENIIRQNDVTLKIEACRSMYFMNSAGMENLLRLSLEKELDIEPYIAHIHDPRN